MDILEFVLQVLLGITSLLLTLLILLHKGRGGGLPKESEYAYGTPVQRSGPPTIVLIIAAVLAVTFGGGMSSALGSSGLAERNLNRFTVVLALIWFVAIVALGLITKFQGI